MKTKENKFSMTREDFENLKPGDLVLKHNGFIKINDEWPFYMDFAIITSAGGGLVNMAVGEDGKHYGTNFGGGLILIEKGAFVPLPKNTDVVILHRFIENEAGDVIWSD